MRCSLFWIYCCNDKQPKKPEDKSLKNDKIKTVVNSHSHDNNLSFSAFLVIYYSKALVSAV